MTDGEVKNSVLLFECRGERLFGVLSAPGSTTAASECGVVIVVGGPQVRVGSHRQFVQLAHRLACQGYPVLRFDTRGMGDSTGALHSFEDLTPDIGAAVDCLFKARPTVSRVALWGLCDGASAALLYLQERPDPRIAALCLANPWVRSEISLARTQVKHYYRQRLLQPAFWRKLLSGRVTMSAWRDYVRSVVATRQRTETDKDLQRFQVRMALAWRQFERPVLLLMSEQDFTAREFLDVTSSDPAWRGALLQSNVTRRDLADADHTFSDPATARAVEELTGQWLEAVSSRSNVDSAASMVAP